MPKTPKILLGITGSIAAYKAAELARGMQKKGWDVWVVMTDCATQYIGPLTFRALTGHPVPHGSYAGQDPETYMHLGLSEDAAAMVIAPCSAQTLARLAHGMADDVLSCTALSMAAPVLVAPAMNTRMWDNAATRDNAALLKKRGVIVVEPGVGELACGTTGAGRLCDLGKILAAVEKAIEGK